MREGRKEESCKRETIEKERNVDEKQLSLFGSCARTAGIAEGIARCLLLRRRPRHGEKKQDTKRDSEAEPVES